MNTYRIQLICCLFLYSVALCFSYVYCSYDIQRYQSALAAPITQPPPTPLEEEYWLSEQQRLQAQVYRLRSEYERVKSTVDVNRDFIEWSLKKAEQRDLEHLLSSNPKHTPPLQELQQRIADAQRKRLEVLTQTALWGGLLLLLAMICIFEHYRKKQLS
nr:hypothetical protein [uncultured Anaeromusa sp.]